MRSLVLVALVGALAAAPAAAGMYHAGELNLCSDCHTMHASMAHDFNGRATVSATPRSFADGSWLPNPGAPNDHLLKGTETGVCVACHDGQTWAPDVIGPNASSYVRSAGYLPYVDETDQHRGHWMGFTGIAPGGTQWTGFTCAHCHSPHGRPDAFRNLNAAILYPCVATETCGASPPYPTFYLSSVPFSSGLATQPDVRIDALYTPGTGAGAFTAHLPYYSNEKVFYENGDTNALDLFCGKCHGQFHNDGASAAPGPNQLSVNRTSAGGQIFVRHPTRRVITRPTNATTPSFTTKVYATQAASYVGCLSCHKAHGTSNPFALFYPTVATAERNLLDNTESGAQAGRDTGYAGSCTNCHDEAR